MASIFTHFFQYKSQIRNRWESLDPNLRALLLGMLFLGINQGILNSTFNNYLHDLFTQKADERGFLEFPRELPGFAIVFITGLLSAFSMRRWAMLVGIFSAVGVLGLGFASPGIWIMMLWMIMWSLADHLFMPVEGTLGLQFAKAKGEGKRLGQLSGARNLAMIIGTLIVSLTMSLGLRNYAVLYAVAGVFALVATISFSMLKIQDAPNLQPKGFVFRREYKYYYWLNILFGARKQIFLTFGPWVLVSVFGAKPETIALLLLIAAAIGVVFRQWFGICVDRFGEKAVLAVDAGVLMVICVGYAWSKNVYLLYIFYIIDNLMFATRIARTTYLNRIVIDKRDIAPTLSLGVTVDHAVSMTIPALGGILWQAYGYPSVFIAAALIAVANLFVSLKLGDQ